LSQAVAVSANIDNVIANCHGLALLALGSFTILKERENQALLWLSLTLGFGGLLISALG
jgi:hypothetical protein